jgi:hypothetical protein
MAGSNAKCYNQYIMENSIEALKKLQIDQTYDSAILFPGYSIYSLELKTRF